MKQDIRLKTCIVIERDGQYLSRIEMLTNRVVWDPHVYSAYRTRSRKKAKRAIEKYGGRLMLFNPVVGRVRAL